MAFYYMYPYVDFCKECMRNIDQAEIDIYEYEQVHMACGCVLSSASDCLDARPPPDYENFANLHEHFAPLASRGPATRIGAGRGSRKLVALNVRTCKIYRCASNRHIADALNEHLRLAEAHLDVAHKMFLCAEEIGGTVPQPKRKATYAVVVYLMLQTQDGRSQRSLAEIQRAYDCIRQSHEPKSITGTVDAVRDLLLQSDAYGDHMRKATMSAAHGLMWRVLQALCDRDYFQKWKACEAVLNVLERDGVGLSVNTGTQVGAVIWYVRKQQEWKDVTLQSVARVIKCAESTITKHLNEITGHLRQTR